MICKRHYEEEIENVTKAAEMTKRYQQVEIVEPIKQ